MEDALWHLLASSRGGPSRVRILRAVDERPRNANQLAEELELDYTTVRHHLDRLVENNVLQATGGYGAVYRLSDQAKAHRQTIDEIVETVDPD